MNFHTRHCQIINRRIDLGFLKAIQNTSGKNNQIIKRSIDLSFLKSIKNTFGENNLFLI